MPLVCNSGAPGTVRYSFLVVASRRLGQSSLAGRRYGHGLCRLAHEGLHLKNCNCAFGPCGFNAPPPRAVRRHGRHARRGRPFRKTSDSTGCAGQPRPDSVPARMGGCLFLAGLAVVTALAWIYLFAMGGEMPSGGNPGEPRPWRAADVALTFVMWAVMMVAMMLPGTAPAILLYSTVSRRQRERGGRGGSIPCSRPVTCSYGPPSASPRPGCSGWSMTPQGRRLAECR